MSGYLAKKCPSICFLISLEIINSAKHCQGCQATLKHGTPEVMLLA